MILGIYLFCLLLGGILILSSIVFGAQGHETDHHAEIGHVDGHAEIGHADTDLQHDHELHLSHDLHAEAEIHVDHDSGEHGEADSGHEGSSWAEGLLFFLSMRFWTFALASFGLAGTLTHLLGLPLIVGLPTSLGLGLVSGYSVAKLFQYLRRSTMGTAVSARSLVGSEARVLLPVGPEKMGKVRMLSQGQDIDLPAITHQGALLPIHARVLVVDVNDGVAEIAAVPGLLGLESASETASEAERHLPPSLEKEPPWKPS